MALPLSLDIALQHLLHRRRQTLVSLLGVALGVAFFIAIASMMQGFQRDFVARIIDIQPHVIVKDDFREPPRQPVEQMYGDGAIDLRGLKPREETRGIRGALSMLAVLEEEAGVHVAPTLSGNILLRFGGKDVSANVTGIIPDQQRKVTHLEKDLIEGTSLDALYTTANGIIIGDGVAKRGGIRMDDLISVVSPVGSASSITGWTFPRAPEASRALRIWASRSTGFTRE